MPAVYNEQGIIIFVSHWLLYSSLWFVCVLSLGFVCSLFRCICYGCIVFSVIRCSLCRGSTDADELYICLLACLPECMYVCSYVLCIYYVQTMLLPRYP